jgi:hypothetical protein
MWTLSLRRIEIPAVEAEIREFVRRDVMPPTRRPCPIWKTTQSHREGQ